MCVCVCACTFLLGMPGNYPLKAFGSPLWLSAFLLRRALNIELYRAWGARAAWEGSTQAYIIYTYIYKELNLNVIKLKIYWREFLKCLIHFPSLISLASIPIWMYLYVYLMYTNVYTFCSYQSAVPCVLPYPFGWRQHRFINPIHGNCILSYDSYDCEPFRSKVLSFCFHLLIVINLCLSVLCIKSDFCIYLTYRNRYRLCEPTRFIGL